MECGSGLGVHKSFGSTSARMSGRPWLLCTVHLDLRATRANSVFRARIRTARFRSAAHAHRMTRPRLFHIGSAAVFSRPLGRLAPVSSTTAPRGLCLLPIPRRHACTSSTCRWPWLGPARPHGHQHQQSAFTT
jgi:hypothetical protein